MASITNSPSDNAWTEPESANNTDTPAEFPVNNATQTESGHLFEMDDTATRERIRLQHRTGTFIEMHPNGDEVHKVLGKGYEICIQGKNVLIKGVCNVTIEGDCNMHVTGNKVERIDGNYDLQVKGNMIARCMGSDGMQLISDKDMSIASNSAADGAMYISAGNHLYLASALKVAGSISADTINAESRINAGTGLYAGPFGVFSVGPVISEELVEAPLGQFAIMDAVLMTDIINSNIYKTHTHLYIDTNDAGAFVDETSPPQTPFFGV